MIRKKIQHKKKICKGCKTEQYLFGHSLCKFCYNKKKTKEKIEKLKAEKPKKSKPTKQVSKKHRTDLNEYTKVRAAHLKIHSCCEVGLPGCSGDDTRLLTIHHKKGRIGDLLLDTDHFLVACLSCHSIIELNPTIAYEKGWSLSRLNND